MSTGTLTASVLNPPPSLKVVATATNTILSKISIAENSLQNANVPPNSAIPNLEQHLQNARNCAATWNSAIKPSVASSVQNITLFSNSFSQLYTQLSANATALQANLNNATAAAAFQSEINTLLETATNIYTQPVQVQNSLVGFQATNASVARDFQSDYNATENKLQVDEADLQTLNQQINAMEQQLADAERQKDENSRWWEVVLTLGISELVSLIEDLQGKIDTTNQNIQNYQQQAKQDQQEIAALNTIAGTLASLLSITSTMQSTMLVYITSWQSLSDNIKELQDMANISPTDGWVLSDVQAVNSEWQVIAAEVATL